MKPNSANRNQPSMATRRDGSALLWMAIGAAAILWPAASRAATTTKYTAQGLLKRGDKVPGTSLQAAVGLEVDALNDSGQLLFEAYGPSEPALIQYSGGHFTPIVGPGVAAPTSYGRWPSSGGDFAPVSMNQTGNAAFTVQDFNAGHWIGTFRWDAKAGKSTVVALNGMTAGNNMTYDQAGFPRPATNNHDEIAFAATLKDPTGKVEGPGLFFQGQDGKIQPVALPGQAGPDGAILDNAYWPTLSDDGRIAFLARRYGQLRPSAYLFEGGQITPIAVVGTAVPGGKITEVVQAWVNNRNQDVLVEAILNDLDDGPYALYRWSGGKLSPVVVPGQSMPGGGQLTTISNAATSGNANFPSEWSCVSFANELGQHAFYALVSDSGITRTAAYLLDTDGSLSVIVRSGDTNELGTIARVGTPQEEDGASLGGFGIALNSQEQVAVLLKPVNGATTLSLLTPTAP